MLWAINLIMKIKIGSSMFKNQIIFIIKNINIKKDVEMENVQIMNKNYSNYHKRKVSEAIYIKTNGPLLHPCTGIPNLLFFVFYCLYIF